MKRFLCVWSKLLEYLTRYIALKAPRRKYEVCFSWEEQTIIRLLAISPKYAGRNRKNWLQIHFHPYHPQKR